MGDNISLSFVDNEPTLNPESEFYILPDDKTGFVKMNVDLVTKWQMIKTLKNRNWSLILKRAHLTFMSIYAIIWKTFEA